MNTNNDESEMQPWKPPGGDVDVGSPHGGTTPAQARVDAVSTVLHAAYQRASTLKLTPEQDAALNEDFPDDAFKPGAAGKEHLIYIEHAFLRDRFNAVLGRGQWAMVRMRPHWAEQFRTAKGGEATRIYAEAALLIKGCYVGEAIGDMVYYPNNESQNYGDAAEGAMTAAFRRCAKNFGVGLQAWKKDFCEGWKKRQGGGQSQHGPTAPYTPRSVPAVNRPAPTPSPAPQARPAATAQQATRGATAKTRDWMIAKLTATFQPDEVRGYGLAVKILTQPQTLTDWPLNAVPSTGPALRELSSKIQSWIQRQAPAADPDAPPAEDDVPMSFGEEDIDSHEWSNVVLTVPPAGSKKIDYMKSPDTIRSLYHKMKSGDGVARTRIWGLAKSWSPKPWVSADGQTRIPSERDIEAREALDQFCDWHASKEGK